jgi:hypothetical protein
MEIRMLQQMSGPRGDGQPWPAVGAMITVPDGEAADLIAARIAEAVPAKIDAPARKIEQAETRPLEQQAETRAPAGQLATGTAPLRKQTRAAR